MKTPLTIKIEQALQGFKRPDPNYKFVLVATEVNLAGRERVDVARFEEGRDHHVEMTCYEIKISRADFRSENGHNFVGNKNYYALPAKIAYTLEHEIPEDIGIIIYQKGRLFTRRECESKSVSPLWLSAYLFSAIKRKESEIVDENIIETSCQRLRGCHPGQMPFENLT
jgi:hypothetical protein